MKAGEIVERDGTEYLVVGKTFGSKVRLQPGDTVSVEGEQLNVERSGDGLKVTLWAPEVMGRSEGKPEALQTVVARAKRHGVLREKVRGEDGEVEYLPNEPGEPATADKSVDTTEPLAWGEPDATSELYDEKASVLCPSCGAEIGPVDECPHCGAKLVAGLNAGVYPSETSEALDKDYVCLKCGFAFEDLPEDNKCPKCGGQLVETHDLGLLAGAKAGAEGYPDESKTLRFVAQNHARGRSVHLDMRFEYKRGGKNFLRGWTVAHQVAGAIKEPITTVKALKEAEADVGNWKMDLKTGHVKPRQTRGGLRKRGDLRAFRKGPEIPADWLNVQGVTEKQDPGEPIPAGATRQYPGVFTILAKGRCDWGCMKAWAQEWFLDGDWKGRWMFRLVRREGQKWYVPENEDEWREFDLAGTARAFWAKQVLPPGEAEERPRTEAMWLLMQPLDQRPYVLSPDAVKEGWLPPRGVSCLPRKMRSSVPPGLRYWEQERKRALGSRRELAEFEELGGTRLRGEKQRAVDFILTKRTWKGQTVIRFGPSTTVHDLFVDGWRVSLQSDPRRGETAAQPAPAGDKLVDTDGEAREIAKLGKGDVVDVKPGTKYNPTKETPCRLEVVDKGGAQELSREETFRKYEFKGDELKGTWFFRAEDEKEPEGFWLVSRSEGPETKEGEVREITVLIDDEQLDDKARGQGQGVGGPRQGDAGADVCVCPKCGKEYEHERGTPCNERQCEDCGAALVGKEASAAEAEEEAAGAQTERAVVGATVGSLGQQVKAVQDNIVATGDAVFLVGDDGQTVVAEFPYGEGAEYADRTGAVKAAEAALAEALRTPGETQEDTKAGKRVRKAKLDVLKEIKEEIVESLNKFAKVIGWGDYDDEKEPETPLEIWLSAEGKKSLESHGTAAFAFKALDGQTWWMQWTTNAFQDREREIFTTKSIEDFVERHRDEDKKGEFWYRHVPGTKFGDVRWQAVVDRFLVQAGPFDDTPIGRAFKEFFSRHPNGHPTIAPEGWGTSHSYLYDEKDRRDGVYNWFEIKESTVLPLHAASNQWNPLPQILTEVTMNEQEKKDLETIGGQSLVEMVLEAGESRTKELEEANIGFKASWAERIRKIAGGIKDEAEKKRVMDFCERLEKAYPYPKPGSKETEEQTEEPTGEAAGEREGAEPEAAAEEPPAGDEVSEGEKAGKLGKLGQELRMIAGRIGGEAGKKLKAMADEMAAKAESYGYPKPEKKEAGALTREEVAEAMKAVIVALRGEIAEATKAAAEGAAEVLRPLVESVKELQKTDAEKLAELREQVPANSLMAILRGDLGDESAKVDGRTKFAKKGPEETEAKAAGPTGISFLDAMITDADQRQGGVS